VFLRVSDALITAANAQYAVLSGDYGYTGNGIIFAILNLLVVLRTICNDANVGFKVLRNDSDVLLFTNGTVSGVNPIFYMVDSYYCRLLTTTANRTYRINGRILSLLGISPVDNDTFIEFSATNPLIIQLPFQGHEQLMVCTTLGQNNLSNLQEEERIMDSDLLENIGVTRQEHVIYKKMGDGGKLTLTDSTVDVFTIEIRDKWGNLIPDLRNYTLVLGIDFIPVGDSADNSVSLFDVRKRLRHGGYYSMK
jgi:hypothetical protein